MKKMMVMILAVGFAGFASAAMVAWGNDNAVSPLVGIDGSTKLYTSTANMTAFSMYLVPNTVASGDFEPTDALGNAASLVTMATTAGALSGASGSYQYGTDFSNGATFYAIAYMTFDGNDYFMVINAGTWTLTAADNGGVDAFYWNAGTYGGLTTTGEVNKWQAVPEPTAAALLALGAVALGLRRRFRA